MEGTVLITDFLQKRKHPVPCRRWEDNDGKRKKRLWYIMQQRMQHAGKAVIEYRIEKQDRDGIMPEEKEHILKEEYGISMEMKIREELEAMCNLSEAIEERGVERGSFIAFSSLVRDGLLRTDEAARRMKMSEEDFVARMREERER